MKLLSTFNAGVKVVGNVQAVYIGLKFRSETIEGVSNRLAGEFVFEFRRLGVAFIRLDRSLCGLAVSVFIIAVFER